MSFSIQQFVINDTVTLRYQIKENGLPKNITGLEFKYGARVLPSSVNYKIGPIDAIITDAENGFFEFTILLPSEPFNGVYEITMFAGIIETTLTPPGGVEITVVQDIIR
ncbi:MAG: hypothetical protein KAI64_04745 [Thermoplasmata archaeon]|nr:hypothetical protein [Thermoplasmata archaeon]